jgi:hypothetical protein
MNIRPLTGRSVRKVDGLFGAEGFVCSPASQSADKRKAPSDFHQKGQGRQNYSAFAALIISISFARYSFHWGRFFQ